MSEALVKVKPEDSNAARNPFFDFIDEHSWGGSARELIGNAFLGDVTPWDLPEDPEELKKVLCAAVDYANAHKKAIELQPGLHKLVTKGEHG
jgi:hypothetical protein